MNSKHILEIKFLSFREKPEIDKLRFNSQTYKVKPEEEIKIEIPQSFFDENESKKSSIKLFFDMNLINECILEIFKGYNYFYCFLDEKGYTFQLLFNKIEPNIKIPLYKENFYNITKYDTNNTKNRKRYTFLNANLFSILINNKYFTIPEFISDFNSYQLSFYDLGNKLILKRPNLLNENDEYNFLITYNKYNSSAYEFKENIEKKLKKNKFEDIKELLNEYDDLKDAQFCLNKNKFKLDNILNNDFYIDFYENISLYKIIIYFQNDDSLKDIIEYYFKIIKNIKLNNSLKIYQKILLIDYFIGLVFECKSKEELEELNFSYYLMETKEDDSVLDIVEKFFQKYRDIITEESPIFEKLIELYGSPGIYKNESFYCFNMINLDELKKHLKEIETNIFIIHDLNNKNLPYNNINSGIVSINVHNIKQFNLFEFPLDKKLTEEKKEIGEIISSKIIYYMLHEVNIHKKLSPQTFIEDGKIYTLCKKYSNLEGKNLIKVIPEGKISNDGYFYELIYGKVGDLYVFELLENLNDLSDLLFEVDLWVNNVDLLREYVKYKYTLHFYCFDFKSKKSSIQEKINDYKNKSIELQNDKNIYIDTLFKKEKAKKYTKKKLNSKCVQEEFEDEPNPPKEVLKKNKKEKNNEESEENKIIKEIITDEEDEEEEEEESEKEVEGISDEEKNKILMQIPYETLLTFKPTGILTRHDINIHTARRRRALQMSVRYRAIIDNNT